jgi:large repetitive protein
LGGIATNGRSNKLGDKKMKKMGRVLAVNMLAAVFVAVLFSLSFAIDAIKPKVPGPTSPIDPYKGQCRPVNITSESSLPPATIGQPYQFQLKTSGGKEPITFQWEQDSSDTRSPIPAGLKFSPNGLISGTPAARLVLDNGQAYQNAYTHSFKVRVTDSCPNVKQSIEKIFTLEVKHSCGPLSITSQPQLPTAPKGVPYKYQIQVSGGKPPYGFKNPMCNPPCSLPEGLSLNPATGEISGIPNPSSTSGSVETHFLIVVNDSSDEYQDPGSASDYSTRWAQHHPIKFTLLILDQCKQIVSLSPDTLPQATVGQTYKYKLDVSCDPGQLPITYSIVIGSSLPEGLNLDSTTGEISGTPKSAGNYSFRIRAIDNCYSGKQSLDKYFSLTVK